MDEGEGNIPAAIGGPCEPPAGGSGRNPGHFVDTRCGHPINSSASVEGSASGRVSSAAPAADGGGDRQPRCIARLFSFPFEGI